MGTIDSRPTGWPADAPDVLTVPEVAELLGVPQATVRTMARDGRLPRLTGIHVIRIPAWAVEEMVDLEAPPEDCPPAAVPGVTVRCIATSRPVARWTRGAGGVGRRGR